MATSKRIFTSVRPARVACLINQDDEDWQVNCLRVIEFFSSVWGGAHNIIIPTDGKNLTNPFWEILSAYDADYFYHYSKTVKDLKTLRPDEYNEWLDTQLESYLGGDRETDIDIDFARRQIEDMAVRADLTPQLSPEFPLLIRKKLAPFHVPGQVVHGIISDFPPRFPLTPITTALSGCAEKANLVIFNPSHQGLYPLWLASVTGLINEALRLDLSREGSVNTIPTGEYSIDLVTSERTRNAFTSAQNFSTPFQLTNLKLATYRSVKGSFLTGPMIVVAGERVFDFCLYYSLARLRQPVLWLPNVWLKSTRTEGGTALFDLFSQSLRSSLHAMDSVTKCIFTSHSLDQKQLEVLVDDLDRASLFRSDAVGANSEIAFDLDRLTSRPLRLFEVGNASRPTSLVVQESSEIELFETPKPKNFPNIHPHEHRWITDVIVSGHYLPRNPSLGEWTIRSPILGSHGARIGAGTLSYSCPNIGYAGGDIDTVLVRPTIFVPSPLEIFKRIFWSIGYESKLSDKGFFADDAIRKFGGLDAIGSFLRDPFTRQLIFKFLDSSEQINLRDDGCLLNDQRRYLPFPAISKLLGGDVPGQKAVELLLSKDILYRGCIFKCSSCRNSDWFGLDEFTQTFKCKRCGATQHASSENYWYAEHEPGWFYKLDEIVYQFLHHNGYVSCLALDWLRAKSQDSFLFTGDLELIKSGSNSRKPEFELDIVAIVDGEIVLGEAKKNDKLEDREIKKYFHLAGKTGAKKLIFATFAASWSDGTRTNIERIIDGSEIQSIILSNSNLISGQ